MGSEAAASDALAALVRLVHRLELELPYVTDADLLARAGPGAGLPAEPAALQALIAAALADLVLLRDHRERYDPGTGATAPVTLYRVNFVHPLVRRALGLES
jgi:hypothetical protein